MNRVLFFLSFFLSFFTVYSLFGVTVYAQDTGWVITSFASDMTLAPSGVVAIQEEIVTDFKELEKHGIYRDIPYVYETTDGSSYYTEIAVSNVLQDGEKTTYKVYKNGSYVRIQIGDADKTISGIHTYTISYTVKGIIQTFDSVDELYWNVTGNQWGVPIEAVTAKVNLPQNGISQLGCYEGVRGSKASCTATKVDEKTANFVTTQPLQPAEGMTIAVGFTKGLVPLLRVEKPKTVFEKLFEPVSLLLFAIVLLGGIAWTVITWYKKGRDITIAGAYDTIVVEFTPPQDLRPAELGLLMDEKADTLDVTATIIDLVAKGYLTITEIPKKWLFGTTDYELARTAKADTDLVSYEKMLLDRIFDTSKKKKVSSLKNDFYDDLAKIKEEMYNHMVKKGVFVAHPEKTRSTYTIMGILLFAVGICAAVFGSISEYVYSVSIGVALVPVSILIVFFSRSMSRRSAKGTELYRRVKGYRLFINTAEKYRQRFFEKEHLFQQVLPYAIVFGLTGKFAEAMKEIGLKNPTIAGYYGVHPFNAHTFTTTVSDFSNSFSSAAASTPSSSGSGGGGSSGGGFGGGGGGSW